MNKVSVISSELDGAELRREKQKNNRYLYCDGGADDAEINEALIGVNHTLFVLPDGAWERIFGVKNDG